MIVWASMTITSLIQPNNYEAELFYLRVWTRIPGMTLGTLPPIA